MNTVKMQELNTLTIDAKLKIIPMVNQQYVNGMIDGFLLSNMPSSQPIKEEKPCACLSSSA